MSRDIEKHFEEDCLGCHHRKQGDPTSLTSSTDSTDNQPRFTSQDGRQKLLKFIQLSFSWCKLNSDHCDTKCADACIMSRPLRVHQTLHRPGNTCKLDQKYQNCILYPSGFNLIFPGLIRSCTFQLQCMSLRMFINTETFSSCSWVTFGCLSRG